MPIEKQSEQIRSLLTKGTFAQYPDGNFIKKAEEALIEKEINATTAGKHGELPPLQRTDYGYGSTSTVEIENATQYTLTLYYSGTDKKKIEIPSHRKQTIVLTNVIPFTGKETLKDGEYSGYYYIETRTRYY